MTEGKRRSATGRTRMGVRGLKAPATVKHRSAMGLLFDPEAASSSQHFVLNEMKPNDAWCRVCILEITIDHFANIGSEFLACFRLCVDAETESAGDETAFRLVFTHFEDNLGHV